VGADRHAKYDIPFDISSTDDSESFFFEGRRFAQATFDATLKNGCRISARREKCTSTCSSCKGRNSRTRYWNGPRRRVIGAVTSARVLGVGAGDHSRNG
jgi:hypothetical protein